MNDILEEVVGQISYTETEEESEFIKKDDAVLTEGKVHLRTLSEELGLELHATGCDTVGGYVMEKLGRLPRSGDEIESDGYHLRVTKMVGRRIGAVEIRPLRMSAGNREGDDA
jgi:putative hemolysin